MLGYFFSDTDGNEDPEGLENPEGLDDLDEDLGLPDDLGLEDLPGEIKTSKTAETNSRTSTAAEATTRTSRTAEATTRTSRTAANRTSRTAETTNRPSRTVHAATAALKLEISNELETTEASQIRTPSQIRKASAKAQTAPLQAAAPLADDDSGKDSRRRFVKSDSTVSEYWSPEDGRERVDTGATDGTELLAEELRVFLAEDDDDETLASPTSPVKSPEARQRQETLLKSKRRVFARTDEQRTQQLEDIAAILEAQNDELAIIREQHEEQMSSLKDRHAALCRCLDKAGLTAARVRPQMGRRPPASTTPKRFGSRVAVTGGTTPKSGQKSGQRSSSTPMGGGLNKTPLRSSLKPSTSPQSLSSGTPSNPSVRRSVVFDLGAGNTISEQEDELPEPENIQQEVSSPENIQQELSSPENIQQEVSSPDRENTPQESQAIDARDSAIQIEAPEFQTGARDTLQSSDLDAGAVDSSRSMQSTMLQPKLRHLTTFDTSGNAMKADSLTPKEEEEEALEAVAEEGGLEMMVSGGAPEESKSESGGSRPSKLDDLNQQMSPRGASPRKASPRDSAAEASPQTLVEPRLSAEPRLSELGDLDMGMSASLSELGAPGEFDELGDNAF